MRIEKREDGSDLAIWAKAGMLPLAEQKDADLREGIVRGIASTNQIDRDGERLERGIFDKSLPGFIEAGAPLQWAHMGHIPVVGQVVEMSVGADGYPFVARFNTAEPLEVSANLSMRPHPKLLSMLYGNAMLRAFSVGFNPDWDSASDKDEHKWEGQTGATFFEGELLELSCCNVGSNRQALSEMAALAGSFKALGVAPPAAVLEARELLFTSIASVEPAAVSEFHYEAVFCPVSDFVKVRCIAGTGKTPDRIIGYRESGASALQSFRYPLDRFSSEHAKAHAKEHGASFVEAVEPGKAPEPIADPIVEPAYGVEVSQVLRRANQAAQEALASLS